MANILIACVKYPVASGRYMTDSFRRLGHDVYVVGPETGNKVWGIEVNPKWEWYEPGIPPGWKPDLCITMDTNFNVQLDWDCPHVIYTVDNHVRDVSKKVLGIPYSHYFLAHHDGPAMPVCDCYDAPCTWLPCAYDPVWFTPSPIPMAERDYDVAIVGMPYLRRAKIIEKMRLAGLKVWAGLGPLYEEYAFIYHRARISLCVSIAGDVAQRVFETAAMGCMILSDELKDAARLGLQKFNATSGSGYCNYYGFGTDDEAVSLAKDMIQMSEFFQDQVANAAIRWARPHTWEARAKTILETMGLL